MELKHYLSYLQNTITNKWGDLAMKDLDGATQYTYGELMIYYCQNEKDVKAVKKTLKKVSPEQWTTVVREKFNKDSVTVRMEKGLFKQGLDRRHLYPL